MLALATGSPHCVDRHVIWSSGECRRWEQQRRWVGRAQHSCMNSPALLWAAWIMRAISSIISKVSVCNRYKVGRRFSGFFSAVSWTAKVPTSKIIVRRRHLCGFTTKSESVGAECPRVNNVSSSSLISDFRLAPVESEAFCVRADPDGGKDLRYIEEKRLASFRGNEYRSLTCLALHRKRHHRSSLMRLSRQSPPDRRRHHSLLAAGKAAGRKAGPRASIL